MFFFFIYSNQKIKYYYCDDQKKYLSNSFISALINQLLTTNFSFTRIYERHLDFQE